jgi:two-component system sensor histidine kinase KdpD
VIGVIETHGRKGIADLASQLERVPMRKIEYKGTVFEELDPDAVKARKPRVVLIDELAHTNIPGSKHRKRYEDVLDLVDAKMEVLSTVNVQHLESIAPTVAAITGIKIRETVPDWVLEHANEIVMVDLTPEALQNRMRRGEVPSEKVDQALKNFSAGVTSSPARTRPAPGGRTGGPQPGNLHEQKDIHDPWPVGGIAVCFSSNPRAPWDRAGRRMARRMDAELYAICWIPRHIGTG